MNTRCTVGHHAQRAEIDAALVAGRAVSRDREAVQSIKDDHPEAHQVHVPAAVQRALDAAKERDVEASDAILAEVEKLKAALTAVRELTRLVELSARLMGELRDREINLGFINIDPETMERMAQMFLARRAVRALPTIAAGTQPVTVVQVIGE